jgi:hypothetical protein
MMDHNREEQFEEKYGEKLRNNGIGQENRFPQTDLKDYIKSSNRFQANIDRFVR